MTLANAPRSTENLSPYEVQKALLADKIIGDLIDGGFIEATNEDGEAPDAYRVVMQALEAAPQWHAPDGHDARGSFEPALP